MMKTFLRLFTLIFILGSVSSCVREDVENCLQYSLKVKAVDLEGNDITTSGSVTSVDVYLFDENGFVRIVPQGSSTDYLLGADKNKKMTLVAWGNIQSDSVRFPELAVGTSLQDARIELVQQADGYHMPTSDIFYSRKELTGTDTRSVLEETLTLTLERRVAGMTVYVKNIEQKFGAGDPCHIVVYGVGNAMNFMGEPTGGTVGYEPTVRHTRTNDMFTTAFRILPTPNEQPLAIRICRGDKVLYTVTEDSKGNPLVALPGEQLNIFIDFESTEEPVDPDNPGGGDNPDNPGGGDNPDNPGGGDNPDNPGGGEDPDEPEKPKTTIKVTITVGEWGKDIDQDTNVR